MVHLKVTKTKRGNRASFEGLLSCGSVWLCPICADKISRKKRSKLDAVLSAHQKAYPGATVLQLTITVRHHYGQSLESVLDRLDAFVRFVMTGRSGLTQSLKVVGVGYPGSLTVLEITHGASGWHPHKHLALFLDSPLSPEQVTQLEAALRKRAAESGKGHRDDLDFDPEIAISLQAGIAGTYLSKWGLSEELSLSTSKGARTSGNRTPWELLDSDDPESRRLWAEYAAATKGRRQSRYSNGLLAALDVESEASDEDLAAEPETGPDPVVFTLTLSRSEYMLIHRKKRHADVLWLAAETGPEAVLHLLDALANDPPFKLSLTG